MGKAILDRISEALQREMVRRFLAGDRIPDIQVWLATNGVKCADRTIRNYMHRHGYRRDVWHSEQCSPTTDNERVKELLKRIIEHPDKHTFSIRDFGFRGSVWGHVVASLIKEKLIKKVSISSGRYRYIQIVSNEELAERLREYGKL